MIGGGTSVLLRNLPEMLFVLAIIIFIAREPRALLSLA